jgi:hypothetical protein
MYLLKVTQINYVSRNQLRSTVNSCQHLNLRLDAERQNIVGVFSSADPKQNFA